MRPGVAHGGAATLARSAAVAETLRRRARTVVGNPAATFTSTPTTDSPLVVLQRDFLNVVGSPTGGTVEAEVTRDADGGMRFYAATGGGGVSDGDKGDITVTASGATWTVESVAAIAADAGQTFFVAIDDTGTLSSLPVSLETGEAIYFFEDDADPVIGGYKEADNPADLASIATVTQSTVADGQLIQAWITTSGLPNSTFIPEGAWQIHINAYKTGGTKETRLFAEVYKRASGGTETLLGTTANSIILTGTEAILPAFNIYIPGTILLATDRLVVKIAMRLVGGGSNPTSVSIRYSGTTAARMSTPAQVLSLDGVLRAANNLSDVASASTARSNLGLGSAATANTGDFAASGDATANGMTCTDSRLLGRDDAGGGPDQVQEIRIGSGLTMTGGELAADATGTNTGDQTITLTGDVTGSGTGSFAATIASAAVTLAKMANIATDRLIGRSTAGTGVPEAITCTAAGRALIDDASASDQRTTLGLGTLATQSGTFSGTSSGTNTGDQTITLTGGVTGSGTGSFAATVVTNANLTGPITSVGNATTIADAELAAIAGLTSAADRLPYFTGSGTAALATFTSAGRALVDDADASAQRTTLGLGTAAVTPATDYQSTLSTELTYVEDFLANDIGGWTQSTGSGGAAYSTPTSTAANPGLMRVSSGGTSGGSVCARPATSVCFFSGTLTWEAIVLCGADAVGAVMKLGLSSLTTGTADPADGVFFDYTKASSANWRIRARKASADTTTTSSTAVTFGSYVKLKITFDGTTATFFVNGSSIGTIASANCPVVVVHPFFFVTQATASAFTYIDVDRLFFRQTGLSR